MLDKCFKVSAEIAPRVTGKKLARIPLGHCVHNQEMKRVVEYNSNVYVTAIDPVSFITDRKIDAL